MIFSEVDYQMEKSNTLLFNKWFLVSLIIYAQVITPTEKMKPHLAHLDKDWNLWQCSNNKNFQTADQTARSPAGPCIAENLGVSEHKPHKQLSLMPREVVEGTQNIPAQGCSTHPQFQGLTHAGMATEHPTAAPAPNLHSKVFTPLAGHPQSVQQRKSRLVPGGSQKLPNSRSSSMHCHRYSAVLQ